MAVKTQMRTIAVSTPGGPAKQVRIQVRSDDQSDWRQFTVAVSDGQVQHLVNQLESRGLQVRVVHYRVPSAA